MVSAQFDEVVNGLTMEDAFPDVEHGHIVNGSFILLQLMNAKATSRGGIILASDTRETDKWNVQIAKVRAIGPTAYRSLETGELWWEGPWCKVGDLVRVPKYGFGADNWEIDLPDGKGTVLFTMAMDRDIRAELEETMDPRLIKSFI